jgi:hypothetical protein
MLDHVVAVGRSSDPGGGVPVPSQTGHSSVDAIAMWPVPQQAWQRSESSLPEPLHIPHVTEARDGTRPAPWQFEQSSIAFMDDGLPKYLQHQITTAKYLDRSAWGVLAHFHLNVTNDRDLPSRIGEGHCKR